MNLTINNSPQISNEKSASGLRIRDKADQNSTSWRKLAGGLRINGQTASEAQAANQAPAVDKPEDSQGPEAKEAAAKEISARFADTFLGRLLNDKDNPKSLEEAQALLDSILDTVEEIKEQFGQPAANEVMAEILTNTERRLSAENIAKAIGGVLQNISYFNKLTIQKGGLSEEEYAQTQETEKKLKDMVKFLNAKEEDSSGPDGSAPKGLTAALNGYFGLPGLEIKEEDQKFFDDDFAWLSEAQIREKNQSSSSHDHFSISVDEFGRENLEDLIHFLRDYLGDDEAAKIIENLSGDDDIFDALGKVNDHFYADTYAKPLPDSYSDTMLDPNTRLPGLLAYQGPGIEKIQKLEIYLNKYMTDKVNELIATNSTVKSRMVEYAGIPENTTGNYGITCWPGAGAWRVPIAGVEMRDQQHISDFQFSFGQVDLTKSYQEREIEQVKGWADFNRQLAEMNVNFGWGRPTQVGADRLMEQYEEMKNAFATNTPSRYKTLSEMVLAGYQPIQKTPPGSLVDQTI